MLSFPLDLIIFEYSYDKFNHVEKLYKINVTTIGWCSTLLLTQSHAFLTILFATFLSAYKLSQLCSDQ